MSSRRARPQDHVDELVAFFHTGEADQGLSSSWGALTAIALGGFGGAPDPERRVHDGRFGLGPARHSAVSGARLIRSALLALPPLPAGQPSHATVLYAAYAPIPWARIIDAGLGKGMAMKTHALLGPHLGLCLLTAAAREGYARALLEQALPLEKGTQVVARLEGHPNAELGSKLDVYITGRVEREPKRGAWACVGGWLISRCLAARIPEAPKKISAAERVRQEQAAADAAAQLAEVRSQVSCLLSGAVVTYGAARAAIDPVPAAERDLPRVDDPPRRARRPTFDPFAIGDGS